MEHSPNPYQPTTTEVSEPTESMSSGEVPEIGGWLVLPAIGLLLGPLLFFGSLLYQIANGEWQAVEDVNASFPGFTATYVGTTFIDGALSCFRWYVATHFFRKRASTPRLMILLFTFDLLSSIFSCAIYSVVLHDIDVEGLRLSFRTLFTSAIWISYFSVSQRVKRTFVVRE